MFYQDYNKVLNTWWTVRESNSQSRLAKPMLSHLTNSPKMVARDGIEPPSGAYETPELPLLYLAIVWLLDLGSNQGPSD